LNKKLFLSVAAGAVVSLPVLADNSNVTLYGRVNVSLEQTETTHNPAGDASKMQVVDNSSRVGFRGKEELGDNFAAIFQVENRVHADTGGDTWASRDSFVGLQGGVGTIRLGRTIGPVYYQTYDSLPENNHDTGNSSDALLAPTIFGNSGFMNNTIWYTSPTMGGFTVEAAYSLLGEAPLPGTTSKPHYIGVVGAFDQGPLHVALAYAETKNSADLDPTPAVKLNDDTAITAMGVYDFKVVVVGLLYERAKSDLLVGDVKRNYYRVSIMAPVGQNEFHVNYGHVDHRLDTSVADAGARQWTLGYNYNLSKRTKVFAFYTRVDNKTNGNYGFLTNLPGVDNRSIAAGIRHNF